MTSIITDAMRIRNAKCFLEDISETGNTYIFMGRPQPWTNDSSPPDALGSFQEQSEIYQSITSYKSVVPDNVYPVTYRFDWSDGIRYKMFDDTLTPSSQEIPEGTYAYYVMNSTYDVYLCLYNGTNPDNPNGVLTIDEPTGQSPVPFVGPNDGYIWKYLYTLSSESIDNHLTSTYLPVEDSPITPTSGEIVVVYNTTSGSGMSSNTPSTPYYYCNVVGDGTGAVVRFIINNGFMSSIEVVRNGSGYTFASIDIVDGRIYNSLSNLDNQTNGISISGVKPSFRLILPPPGGYTKDTMVVLSAYYLSVNVQVRYGYEIAGGDVGFFSGMKFRQYGLINTPKLVDGSPLSGSNYVGCYAVKLAAGAGDYVFGETITQSVGGQLTSGYVVHWDSDNNILFYIQTQLLHSVNGSIIRFTSNQQVNGVTSGTSRTPDIGFTGDVSSAGVSFVDGYFTPLVGPNSGDILYLNNIQPVQRGTDQIENLKFIVQY
jgi:hypothetical protein